MRLKIFLLLGTAVLFASPALDITVHEGTSMSVTAAPDGSLLATDLQGSLWTLPASGGPAHRITGLYDDARQPAFSPNSQTLAYFAFREGHYAIWTIRRDGTNERRLTWGPYDDREPAWSHDGKQLAFASDRSGSYNIWTLDLASGTLHQITRGANENRMPAFSPSDEEIAYTSTRENGRAIWATTLKTASERALHTAPTAITALAWGPSGQIVYHTVSHQDLNNKPLTADENAAPFRVSWVSATEFFYTADGHIRRRSTTAPEAQTIDFTATLAVNNTRYKQRLRDTDSIAPRQALGIVHPTLSPDGKTLAFHALGDIYLMPLGGAPRNLTKDAAYDTDPAWSPDGKHLVYASDKNGGLLQLWLRDVATNQDRKLTNLTTQPLAPAWSPDGARIAFLNVNEMWGAASLDILDLASGKTTKLHDTIFAPGAPTWSPDGKHIALAALSANSKSFREGTNQILVVDSDGPANNEHWYTPAPNLSIDSRLGCGPAWSPDGTQMAAIYEGTLAVWPVSPTGEPQGPIRHLTTEIAHDPAWSADSQQILYQANDKIRLLSLNTAAPRDIPVNLKYTPAIPKGRTIIHAGQLVDGKSPTARAGMDVVMEGNRIRTVAPHSAALHKTGTLIDATNLTAMPGLIEYHTHLQKDQGAAGRRAALAFGVTTLRSPGGGPYEAAEDREANEAGIRPGPRVFASGYMLDWERTYYKGAVAISTPRHFEMELERTRSLQHDLVKSYVRLPDIQQKRAVEFAHGIGIPVASHELYPAALVGVDSIEHTGATSRRGYSPKIGPQQRSYEDVIQIVGKSNSILCPMIIGAGVQKLIATNPALPNDPRFNLYPAWVRAQLQSPGGRGGGRGAPGTSGAGKMVLDARKAGARIVAGTDTPNAFNLHGELASYSLAGMSPYEALKAATVTPAEALGLDAGTIEPGKLADIILVEGNPLEDLANALRVRQVIANGKIYTLKDLLGN